MSQTIIFFGATGGVANACLTAALNSNSYNIIAVVRTPEKLKTQLQEVQHFDEATLNSSRLSIVQGNALDLEDVKRALLSNITAGTDKTLPQFIFSGLGGAPHLTFDLYHPLQITNLDNPTICESAAKVLIAALSQIYVTQPNLKTHKPALAFVSTTGVTRGPEDVPITMRFLYHQILALPHADKKKMEDVYRGNMDGNASEEQQKEKVFASITGIRPTLLMGTGALSEAKGMNLIRAGTEDKPELGYTIQRADVGNWVFENVVQEKGERKWRGEMVSLTS